MSNSKYSSQLRKLHRHITAHDSNGKSIYISSPTLQYHPGPQHVAARTYAVTGFPVELDGDNDIQAYTSGSDFPESMHNHNNVVLPGGTTCNSVEIGPGGMSPMHRTVSFDIAICTDGQMVCELDSGEKVTLYPGDHIIQRGTNHRWSNASKTEPARFVAVTIPCVPFKIGDKLIEEEWST